MLNGHYAAEDNLLYIWTGEPEAMGASAECDADLAVFTSTEKGHHVVGFELTSGGGEYLRLERGYDPEHDTLTIGEVAGDPTMRTQNGALVTHWHLNPVDPDGFMNPIGVTVYGARALMQRVALI